jgi:hypothetical protein
MADLAEFREQDDYSCCTLDEGHGGACVWECSYCAGTGLCIECDGGCYCDDVVTCDWCDGTHHCPRCDYGEVIDDG